MSEKISLDEKILDDYKKAFKEGRKNEVACLRLMRAEFKNKEIQKKGKLDNEEIIQILRSNLKKELESLNFFIKGKRDKLIELTREEITVIERYLPVELSSEEIEDIARKIINERKLNNSKDLGLSMKLVMSEIKGRADGNMVSQIVKKILLENRE